MREVVEEEVEEEGVQALLLHLCRVQMGREEVVNLWSAVGQKAAGEEAGCGKNFGRVARRTASVHLVAAVEGRPCLTEKVAGVARLHVLRLGEQVEAPALTGQGWEAGGQSGLDEAEGPGQTGWSSAQEARTLYWVEGVEVQTLVCSPPF